jgi:hypothetical protein
MRTMNSGRINLVTPYGQAECVSRLNAVIDSENSILASFAALRGSKAVVGWVTESSMRLRKRIGYGNSFQSYLTATMWPEAGGTAISGKIAMHPLVRVAMIVWFGAIVYMAGGPFLRTVYLRIVGFPAEYENVEVLLIAFPVMLACGFGLIAFGRYLARSEARFLTEFLIRELDARERN